MDKEKAKKIQRFMDYLRVAIIIILIWLLFHTLC
jgi:hypothetical protein